MYTQRTSAIALPILRVYLAIQWFSFKLLNYNFNCHVHKIIIIVRFV
jgi:hypothetical protein